MPPEDTNNGLGDQPQPVYSGVQSFMRSEIIEPIDLDSEVDIGVVGIPFDGGQTKRADARHGPGALRERSRFYDHLRMLDLVNVESNASVDYNDFTVRDCGDAPVTPTSLERTRNAAERYVSEVASKAFPLILGGDHFVTLPAFLGYAKTVEGKVGIIHLDAHADLYESKLFGKHWNGSQFLRIHETEHADMSNHAIVGLRGYENKSVIEMTNEQDLHISFQNDIEKNGIKQCVRSAINHATKNVDQVYLSVDIDVVAPAFAPGTGSPEPGGITTNEFFTAMREIGKCDKVEAMDLVEVAPTLEDGINTESIAVKGIMQFLEAKFC